MNAKAKLIGRWIITVLLTGVNLILAVPLLIGAGYTYPAADDFINASTAAQWIANLGPVKGPLCAAWNFFMEWEGRYTSNLLIFTILPFNRFGLNGFRIVMVLISFCFVLSLFFMVNAAINFAEAAESEGSKHSKWNKKLFLSAVLLFAALGLPGTWIAREITYWYTAALSYLMGINCLFISLGCFLSANCHEKNKGYYICSILLAFVAAGYCPQVVSFVCSWLLLAFFVVMLSEKPDRKGLYILNLLPFLASLCGAIINVASPGSLKRSQTTMGEVNYGILDAVKDTFRCYKDEFDQIWSDPVFIALAVILFLACLFFEVRVGGGKNGRPVTWYGALLLLAGVLVSNFLCIFPVILGYHGGGLSNERTEYTAQFEIRFSLLFAVIYIAQYISRIVSEKSKLRGRLYAACALCGILVCAGGFLFLNDNPEELFSGYAFELTKEISDGTVKEVFCLRKEVLDTLEAAEEGTDVYLQMPPAPATRTTYSQGISTSPEDQVNGSIASLFHLHSVAVEYGAR